MQESDIIEMLRKRHPSGPEELISHYGPLMKYIIKPIVSNVQDREECLSEAVMRILDKVHLYDEERGSWTACINRKSGTSHNILNNQGRSIAKTIPLWFVVVKIYSITILLRCLKFFELPFVV